VVFDDKNRERCRRFPVGWAQDRLRWPGFPTANTARPLASSVPGRECVALRPLLLKTSLVLHARSIAYFAPVPSTVKQPDFRLLFEGAPGLYLVTLP
jgi:hypothetical protein